MDHERLGLGAPSTVPSLLSVALSDHFCGAFTVFGPVAYTRNRAIGHVGAFDFFFLLRALIPTMLRRLHHNPRTFLGDFSSSASVIASCGAA